MAGSYYSNNNSYNNYFWDCLSIPLPLCFFVSILFFMLGFSWYVNCESMIEDLVAQVKLFLLVVPLILLLAVHCLSSDGVASLLVPLPERDSLHRAGGSPWGVAFLLVFLLFMLSYQSSFQERWFPLLAK